MLNKKAPEMVLLCETKLKDNHRIFYKEYEIVQNNRSKLARGGGTAILI